MPQVPVKQDVIAAGAASGAAVPCTGGAAAIDSAAGAAVAPLRSSAIPTSIPPNHANQKRSRIEESPAEQRVVRLSVVASYNTYQQSESQVTWAMGAGRCGLAAEAGSTRACGGTRRSARA